MHHSAIEHLRRTDPALASIIDEVGPCEMTPRTEGTHFDALVRAIVYQQLSGKAARTIHGRFEGLFGGRAPLPAEVLATSDEQLRSVGLSRQKIASIKDLAAKVVSGEVEIESLDAMPDDEIIESLIRVRGIGRWSAQMFLMFRLGRPNVLPDLDLGVQKGMQHAYGLPTLPTPKDVLRLGERWAPFASVASWYMWRVLELPRVIARESAARSEARTARKSAEAAPVKATRRSALGVSGRKQLATAKQVAKVAAGRSRARARPVAKASSDARTVSTQTDATSKGATSKGAISKGPISKGAMSTGAAPKRTTPKRTTPKRRG